MIWISNQRSKNITKNNQNLQARGNFYYSENTIGYKKINSFWDVHHLINIKQANSRKALKIDLTWDLLPQVKYNQYICVCSYRLSSFLFLLLSLPKFSVKQILKIVFPQHHHLHHHHDQHNMIFPIN